MRWRLDDDRSELERCAHAADETLVDAEATEDRDEVLDDAVVSPANTRRPLPITSPADGAVFAWKPTITLTATASDPDGTITKVEFRDGTTALAQDTTTPYSYTWRNVAPGNHALAVRATDNTGAPTTSSPVSITVRPKR